MIAAIYARKSTEQLGISDEDKSVHRQIEHAKAYAIKKGWIVTEEHIYQDDGISGAEFVKRPGFLRLMNSLKPKSPFQALIMSEESRLGRESIETSYALKQIIDADVRVFFYMGDQERRLDSAMDKVMLSLSNFASEMEREKASQRTHDAMLRKARAGHVVGGKVFGYDNVDVSGEPGLDGKSHRQCVVRRINPREAAIVRRIFEGYASGIGLTRLAKTFNNEKVPPPRRGIHGWAPSAIREMLRREMYRGVVLWNQSQTIQRGGTKKQRKRPASEWLRLEAPELRIVPEELWDKVRSQLIKTQRCYIRGAGGRLLGRPSGVDVRSRYLLSGIARCAVCGGALSVFNRSRGQYERKVYGCVYYHKRGTAICSNGTLVEMGALDSAVLHSIQEVLDERVLEQAVRLALEKIRAEQCKFPDHRIAIERELSLIETRLHHLVETIARGKGSDSIFKSLHSEEARKVQLASELSELNDLSKVVSLDAKVLAMKLQATIKDVKTLLVRQVPQARQILRKLIEEKLVCQPVLKGVRRGYQFEATGTYGGLFRSANGSGGGQGI